MARLPRLKKGDFVGPTKRGKGSKFMPLVDGNGLPLSIDVGSANPAEEPLIDLVIMPDSPERLIYDRAADSVPLRERLADRGIKLI